jgi:amino acid transporter
MYGLTRATVTLIAAAAAGLLVWIATQVNDKSTGGYWLVYGLIAGAGLVMALSQLMGGWTKWGRPRLSAHVFLWAFVPVVIVVLWIVIFHEPHGGWFRNHIRSWSHDIHITGLVKDFREYLSVLAFGAGLVFGYSFDTAGPAAEPTRRAGARRWRRRRRDAGEPTPAAGPGAVARDREPADRDAVDREERATPAAPQPEPPPREGPPERE